MAVYNLPGEVANQCSRFEAVPLKSLLFSSSAASQHRVDKHVLSIHSQNPKTETTATGISARKDAGRGETALELQIEWLFTPALPQ
jgi:hypothetical protein